MDRAYLVCPVLPTARSVTPVDFFIILLKVVRDAAEEIEGAVYAAESKAGRIEIRDRGIVVLPFHKESPFLSREHL